MPRISIIMPSLNVAPYIRVCMDSVIRQTFQDIEIICIDAGSTDGTLEILHHYMEQDSRVRVLHSERKSYGYQVNIGVAQALGDYIGIVDTDDEAARDMYETLYKTAVESGADYVKGTAEGFFTLSNGERYRFPISSFEFGKYEKIKELSPENTPSLLGEDNFLWYGLYKKELFKQVKLQETEGAAFQDIGALFQTQIHAKKAVYTKKTVYYYRQDNMNASSYNIRSFQYVANEYSYSEKFVNDLPFKWRAFFYRKLFFHVMDRMYAMAVSGNFCEDIWYDIRDVSKRLKQANERGLLAGKDVSDEQWAELEMLWKDPRLLYDKYYSQIMTEKKSLVDVIQHVGNSSMILFGSGKLGKFIHAQFLYRDYKNIVAYCDNNCSMYGKQQYGIRILSPEQAVIEFPDIKYVIANKYYAEEMRKQLVSLRVKDSDIMVYTNSCDIRLFGVSLNEVD